MRLAQSSLFVIDNVITIFNMSEMSFSAFNTWVSTTTAEALHSSRLPRVILGSLTVPS